MKIRTTLLAIGCAIVWMGCADNQEMLGRLNVDNQFMANYIEMKMDQIHQLSSEEQSPKNEEILNRALKAHDTYLEFLEISEEKENDALKEEFDRLSNDLLLVMADNLDDLRYMNDTIGSGRLLTNEKEILVNEFMHITRQSMETLADLMAGDLRWPKIALGVIPDSLGSQRIQILPNFSLSSLQPLIKVEEFKYNGQELNSDDFQVYYESAVGGVLLKNRQPGDYYIKGSVQLYSERTDKAWHHTVEGAFRVE